MIKTYPDIQVRQEGKHYALYVNGVVYARRFSLEALSDKINEAIRKYIGG